MNVSVDYFVISQLLIPAEFVSCSSTQSPWRSGHEGSGRGEGIGRLCSIWAVFCVLWKASAPSAEMRGDPILALSVATQKKESMSQSLNCEL